jgi:hypothetical protein
MIFGIIYKNYVISVNLKFSKIIYNKKYVNFNYIISLKIILFYILKIIFNKNMIFEFISQTKILI